MPGMEWDAESRKEQAESLRWLLDHYEAGDLTCDVRHRYAEGTAGEVTTLEVVRAITTLDGYAETIRDELPR